MKCLEGREAWPNYETSVFLVWITIRLQSINFRRIFFAYSSVICGIAVLDYYSLGGRLAAP